MSGKTIKAPFLSKDAMEARARVFLAEYHPDGAIPIPIEEIIDVRLRIDIVPVPGLTAAFSSDGDGVESFVTSSLDSIYVDEEAFRRQTNRYRFTIAHELAHILLHKEVFSQLRVSSIADWKRILREIPEREHDWLEWQAYFFAGHLVVPTDALEREFARASDIVTEADLGLSEPVRLAIEKYLADVFQVSSEVIHRRIEAEELWP